MPKSNKKDIEIGINVVQPTEEKLTLLGQAKNRIPGFVKGKPSKTKAKPSAVAKGKKGTDKGNDDIIVNL